MVTVDVEHSYLAGVISSPSLAFRHALWSLQKLLRVVVETKKVLIYMERDVVYTGRSCVSEV